MVMEPVVDEQPDGSALVPDMAGMGFTEMDCVFTQPLTSVYVMMLVPVVNPLTTPVLLMVATVVLEEVQGVVTEGVPDPVKVKEAPTQTPVPPVILCRAFTWMLMVLRQPLLSVYVMVVLPADKPVTTPVLLMVATVVLEEVHGLTVAGVPEPLKVMLLPAQSEAGPVMVGVGSMVMVTVFTQPALVV